MDNKTAMQLLKWMSLNDQDKSQNIMQIAIGCMQYDAIYIQSVSLHNAAAYELFSDAYMGTKEWGCAGDDNS